MEHGFLTRVRMPSTSVETQGTTTSDAPKEALLKRVFSFPALLGALLLAALFVAIRDFGVDPDLWWHLKVGQDVLSSHRWPAVDTYSFTAAGTPWMAYEWVGDTLLAVLHGAWGLRGLLTIDFAIGSAVVLALYTFASTRSRNSKAAFVSCGLLLFLTEVSFSLRPQMLGYLFLILTLIALERFREGRPRMLWLLPPLFLVWVNTHGTFIVGLFVFVVYALSGLVEIQWGGLESRRWTPGERVRLGWVLAACLAALAITPYGTKLAAYPFDMAFAQPVNLANILEWQPMPFNLPVGKLFLAMLMGFLIAQFVFRLTWQMAEMILFLAGTAAACLHARLLLVFVPFAAPLFAVIASRWMSPYDPRKDKFILNAVLIIAIITAIVRYFPSQSQLERRIAEHWPVKAVAYLERHPTPRPMFNNYTYGGYLVYALDGQSKVFVDGRADIYERTGVLADYRSITWLEPKALALLQAYNVQSCLIDRNEPLATLLSASGQWKRVYSDEMSAVFVRSQAEEPRAETGK